MNTAGESFIRPAQLWQEVGLRAEQTVVHLGSGAGFYLIPAAHIVGQNGKAVGIDVLPDMLAEVDNRADHEGISDIVKTIRANLENEAGSTLADNSADWVLVANILHQSDPIKIFREAARIVAANGRVLVVEWDTSASPLGPPAASRLSKQQVEAAFGQAGLKIEREFRPSPYHYGFILVR
jgi:ubiquinone/menaquinone biosynthesis C-methylase UbiE